MARSRPSRGRSQSLAALTDTGMLLRLEGTTLILLTADMEQSQTDLAAPERLEFEYMQHLDLLLDARVSGNEKLRILHAGAGACSLPLAWRASRNATQVAVDPDGKLLDLLREWEVVRPGTLKLRHGDARAVLEGSVRTYDVVVRDAFDGNKTPVELSNLAWAQLVRSRLNEGGSYLANIAHGGGLSGKADVAATLETFDQALIVTDRKVWKGARLGNLALMAWNGQGIETDRLEAELRRLPLPVALYRPSQIRSWLGGALPVL